jgi:type IV pilus assembly protein PilE
MSRKRILGFTLVELMVTIAVITVLVSIGYPLYQDQVYKSRRAAARGSLLELAQFMERNYTEANQYDELANGNVLDTGELPFNRSPKEGGTKYYDLTVTATNVAYVLQAVPAENQSGDRCGTLVLSSDGSRTAAEANCW